jgi:hypothetical protein
MVKNNDQLTDADTVDVVGVLKEGGLDLVISVVGPISRSPPVLRTLEEKIANYISAARSEKFLQHYGQRSDAPVVIYISCTFPISDEALVLINRMKTVAATDGVGLELRKHMGSVQ